MLVGRDVLEALCARHAELVFRVEPRDRVNARVGEEVCGLFLPMIEPDSRLQLSEDYAFCHRARAAGFRIWLAPWVRTRTSGPATFAGSLADLAPYFSAPSVSDPEVSTSFPPPSPHDPAGCRPTLARSASYHL